MVGSTAATTENTGAVTSGVKEDVEPLVEKLKTLQTALREKLDSVKPGTPTNQLQDEVRTQCKEIEGLQLKIFNTREAQYSQEAQPVVSGGHLGDSLDYLYALARKLSQALRKIDSGTPEETREWRKEGDLRGERGRKIASEIFESLIAYETDSTGKEFTGLLSEVIVHNLKPNEWQQFVISIINNFLANPDNVVAVDPKESTASIPVKKIYSPARIIQALDKISIPPGELLSFLTSKLNIPVGSVEANKKKSRSMAATSTAQTEKLQTKEGQSCTLSILASVLLLLNSSFKKTQSTESSELVPPGMRRSASSASKGKENPAQKPAQKPEDNIEIKKLNHEESLQAAFYICVWICDNNQFDDVDKGNVLALGLDLVLQIMKFAKISGVRELLRDPNSFLKLSMSSLKLTSPVLLPKFQALLNALLNPKQFIRKKSTADEPNKEEEFQAEETKILLVHHLQTILKWLLTYVLSMDQSLHPSNLKRDELSPSTWLEHICFVLEFLLLAADKIVVADPKKDSKKMIKKKFSERKKSMFPQEAYHTAENDDLLRPGMSRSLSFSQEGTSKSQESNVVNVEDFDKTNTIPQECLAQLISLLSTKATLKHGFTLNSCTKGWSLLMKTILKVKVTILIEGKTFNSLIESFLSASEDIQQIMFPEIIDLTQNLLKHQTHQKELCNTVISVIFNTLNSLNDDKYGSIAFSLLKGWLDILLTKSSPKPIENYNKLPDKAFCKLNAQGALTLFVNLGSYLWSRLNLGSRDGAQNCSELNLIKLQVAEDLLRLLVSSESSSNLLAISELFANFKKYSREIKKAIEYYLEWFLVNKSSESSGTPSTDLMKSISEDMMKLFQIIGDYQEVSKVAIAALISGCKKLDQTLLKLQDTQRVSSYTLLQYNSRACSILRGAI